MKTIETPRRGGPVGGNAGCLDIAVVDDEVADIGERIGGDTERAPCDALPLGLEVRDTDVLRRC